MSHTLPVRLQNENPKQILHDDPDARPTQGSSVSLSNSDEQVFKSEDGTKCDGQTVS